MQSYGAAIGNYATNSPACRAVRYRRSLVAQAIDRLAHFHSHPLRILSIAAGHLREAEIAHSVREKRIGEYIALDQDKESLKTIERDYSRYGVTPLEGSVRGILAGKVRFENFDFVYASGLFDYLSQPVGQKLVEQMFDAVRPGGELLIANFLPHGIDVGYMESFMDWHLIYRTDAEALDLMATLPRKQIRNIVISHDPDENVVFVAVNKKGAFNHASQQKDA